MIVLLAVFAHPDDEAFRPGGTLALLAQRGVRVHVLTATRGEAGPRGGPPLCTPEQRGTAVEEVVHRYPDQVWLVIFERGRREHPEEPSRALKYAIHKGGTVPLSFAGGKLVVGGKVPTRDAVIRGVERALARRHDGGDHGE